MKKILTKFKPLLGYHSGTNAIRKIFRYYGYEIEEEMIFGLASALDFTFTEQKQNQLPHFFGRVMPVEFEKNLSTALGIKIKVCDTLSKKRAFDEMMKMLNAGDPVMIYVDVAYLPYLKIPDFYHFGAHSVVVFGYDDEQEIVYISDRDIRGFKITSSHLEEPDDYHILSYDNLILARMSKEKHQPPMNRWLKFSLAGMQEINYDMIKAAILKNIDNMLGSSLKNVGIAGIEYLSQKVLDWKNMDDSSLHHTAYDAFTMIDKVGSTGGGCYRKIYGNFLRIAGNMFDDEFLYKCGAEFIKTADFWDELATDFENITKHLDRDILKKISSKLLTIALREQELFLRMKEYLK